MKLGLIYDRKTTQTPRPIDAGVLREMRPDVLVLMVHSLKELADRARELAGLRVSAIVQVPIERMRPSDRAELVAIVAGCRWIVGVLLGHDEQIMAWSQYLDVAATVGEALRLATGHRLVILHAGDLAAGARAIDRWTQICAYLTTDEGMANAGAIRHALKAVYVREVGPGWPRAQHVSDAVGRVREAFGVPIYVEVGYPLGAPLGRFDQVRAWFLNLTRGRWSLARGERTRFLDGWLRDVCIRSAWTAWSRAGAAAFFVCRVRIPLQDADDYGIATPAGASSVWRQLRLVATPGHLGDRWSL